MKKVFLGGTCNESTWRSNLIKKLKINYFNPVVEDWTPECQAEEERQKEICDFLLFVITPKMTGVFSIAEVVECAITKPEKTIFCILSIDGDKSFTDSQLKSLKATGDLVRRYGVVYFTSLEEVAKYLNFEEN